MNNKTWSEKPAIAVSSINLGQEHDLSGLEEQRRLLRANYFPGMSSTVDVLSLSYLLVSDTRVRASLGSGEKGAGFSCLAATTLMKALARRAYRP